MSRVLLLNMSADTATIECGKLGVGISALEPLTSGGIRLVCMSSDGAKTARKKFNSKLIKGEVMRTRHRPTRPLW
ncbi:hypothetical protein [Sphingomonas mesophila]|uniref:hypothetical protein n=1 Tax=Sphingomonas mesophila TaxID=2303576 RepID=UPI000E57FC98|nr:hypothetical protein [Sphingomonas mesophila]